MEGNAHKESSNFANVVVPLVEVIKAKGIASKNHVGLVLEIHSNSRLQLHTFSLIGTIKIVGIDDF